MNADDYRQQLAALLPRGLAWRPAPGGVFHRLLQAFGDTLARLHTYAAGLIDEADPRTTSALLADWERVAGLDAGMLSTAQRRAAVVAQLTAVGGQSAAYYVTLAAAMGYTASVTEYRPHTVESDVDYPLYTGDWAFAWRVRATANSGALPQSALEALIGRIKPAHTVVHFEYY
ncbi:YmfQ family protein [Zoogloea sp. 1C4]|uniref:YmfQ family protein n=1 Tax=Zoogloea sp. 1C4 TaxID=2570190 RepID=UPI001290FBD5|nr:putative phage tail protein [Zoogloea sp. 1C4]